MADSTADLPCLGFTVAAPDEVLRQEQEHGMEEDEKVQERTASDGQGAQETAKSDAQTKVRPNVSFALRSIKPLRGCSATLFVLCP